MRSENGNGHHNRDLTVRLLGEPDLEQVLRLAELDSAVAPPAPLVGVEAGGSLLAAGSMRTREIIADPFQCTADLREMLEIVLSDGRA